MTDVVPFPGSTVAHPGMHPPRISIAMPSHDHVPFMFTYDLASMVAHTVAHLPEDVAFGINGCPGTYVHSARQELIMALISQGVSHILWLDTDMRFPKDAFVRLLRRNKPMVGINYAKRRVPTDYVAIKRTGWEDGDGEPLRLATTPESTGLEEVDALGFGMVLMRTDILADLPDPTERPWFWFDWKPGKGQMGEDVYFCKLLRDAGHKIYVDHDLSKECAHIGQWDYRLEHVAIDGPDQEDAA